MFRARLAEFRLLDYRFGNETCNQDLILFFLIRIFVYTIYHFGFQIVYTLELNSRLAPATHMILLNYLDFILQIAGNKLPLLEQEFTFLQNL